MSLKEYRRKRKFDRTPEPAPGAKKAGKGPLRFVVQKHDATRTHYDFRLEFDGALKSWAVPRGPTLTSGDPRLAVHVEDHPIAYGTFEGTIPKGNYGAGTVMVWDEGTFIERGSRGRTDSEAALRAGLQKGHLTFILQGTKLRGEFALVKIKNKTAEENAWLLIKKHDAQATRKDILKEDRSAVTGRSMDEIAEQAERKGEVWLPGKGHQGKNAKKPAKKGAPKTKALKIPKPTKSSIIRKIRPMEPAFGSGAPLGEGWNFEVFGAGNRSMAEVEKGAVQIYSRALISLNKKYPAVVEAFAALKHDVVLDGEILRRKGEFVFVASDLLYIDGKDLRRQPLAARKAALAKLKLKKPLAVVTASAELATLPLETSSMVVAKKLDSAYDSGLTKEWLRFRVRGGKGGTAADDAPPLTHLEKIYWPKEGYTKGDLLKYYESVAEYILPHLVDRPQSLHRQPDGIRNEGFFHKDMASFLPKRVQTQRVFSESSGKTINYALCQDKWSLLYLINLGCIELNPWLSRRQKLENPDLVVIDLDPDGNAFKDVVKIALEVRKVLDAVGAKSFCKTSGASGLHICIPTGGKFEYEIGRKFAEAVCQIVYKKLPKLTSVERNPAKRPRKIYLDFLQNRRGQTLAAPYCVRPRPRATVSTPLKWSEVKPSLKPESFTIENTARRLAKVDDLWKPLLNLTVDIEACMKRLLRRFHI